MELAEFMTTPAPDNRSLQRKLADEQIANEPQLAPPNLPPDARAIPLEQRLVRKPPIAVNGIVENGLVRPLDPGVHLPENARVIIVAADAR